MHLRIHSCSFACIRGFIPFLLAFIRGYKFFPARRLMNIDDKTIITPLASCEAFRDLNPDVQAIINKSETVKKAKREANDRRSLDPHQVALLRPFPFPRNIPRMQEPIAANTVYFRSSIGHNRQRSKAPGTIPPAWNFRCGPWVRVT